jgi:hypothetical protein
LGKPVSFANSLTNAVFPSIIIPYENTRN